MPDHITPFRILLGVIFLSIGIFLYQFNRWVRHRKLPLPPGPKRFPIISPFLELSQKCIWSHFARYNDVYGPISSITLFGQTVIILNDRETAVDLLDRRSSIYSDRPSLTFAKMCDMGNFLTLLDYGNEHKAQRKVIHRAFGSKTSVLRLRSIIEVETRRFLGRILTNPGNLESYIQSLTGAIMLKVIYGYSVETKQPDPLIHTVEETLNLFLHAIQPGSWLVDNLPILRHIPEWMPGSGFKLIARAWRKCVNDFADKPYEFVKQQMAAGIACPSFVSSLLEQDQNGLQQHDEFVYKWAAATILEAGSDTTVSLIHSFFLAMVLYPDVQTKAQAEIDAVIGPDRLPTSFDRDNLPYVEATVKEALRWHTVAPMGIPHVVSKDDIYRGYLISKGSVVVPNIWSYNHDPSNYHDPFTFKPERFLAADGFSAEADPGNTAFGFGRRVCLGKRLAESIVFHAVAMTIATLSVSKARDADGLEITPVYEVTDSMSSHPKPFACSITPRSAKARELVMLNELKCE